MKKTKSKLAGLQITPQQLTTIEGNTTLTVFEPGIERELSQIHPGRQEIVRSYLGGLFAKGRRLNTVYGSMHSILTLESIGKPYKSITSENLIAWAQVIDARYSRGTAQLYRVKVRSFLAWIYNGDNEDADLPDVVRVIKPKTLKQNYSKHVLSKEEVLRMIQGST